MILPRRGLRRTFFAAGKKTERKGFFRNFSRLLILVIKDLHCFKCIVYYCTCFMSWFRFDRIASYKSTQLISLELQFHGMQPSSSLTSHCILGFSSTRNVWHLQIQKIKSSSTLVYCLFVPRLYLCFLPRGVFITVLTCSDSQRRSTWSQIRNVPFSIAGCIVYNQSIIRRY